MSFSAVWAASLFAAFSLLGAPLANARKPPRIIGAPALVEHFWDVRARLSRGKVDLVSVRHGSAPAGKKVRIQSHLGPMTVVLLGDKGRVLARHTFAWPLLGTSMVDDDDWRLGAGLTAETDVRVPHVLGLREVRVEDAAKRALCSREARWPGEPADAALPPFAAPAEEADAALNRKREPRELNPR